MSIFLCSSIFKASHFQANTVINNIHSKAIMDRYSLKPNFDVFEQARIDQNSKTMAYCFACKMKTSGYDQAETLRKKLQFMENKYQDMRVVCLSKSDQVSRLKLTIQQMSYQFSKKQLETKSALQKLQKREKALLQRIKADNLRFFAELYKKQQLKAQEQKEDKKKQEKKQNKQMQVKFQLQCIKYKWQLLNKRLGQIFQITNEKVNKLNGKLTNLVQKLQTVKLNAYQASMKANRPTPASDQQTVSQEKVDGGKIQLYSMEKNKELQSIIEKALVKAQEETSMFVILSDEAQDFEIMGEKASQSPKLKLNNSRNE